MSFIRFFFRFTFSVASAAYVVSALFFFFAPALAYAEPYGEAIATVHTISGGTPSFGSIVSFDPQTGIFYLSHTKNDRNVFGVVVRDPVLLLSDPTARGVPIVTTGQVSVNVSAQNGPINVGDLLTTSPLPGFAMRAGSSTPYILGTALSSFVPRAKRAGQGSIATGTVRVLLSIGQNPLLASSTGALGSQQDTTQGIGNAVLFRFIKYVLAALVVAVTIYVAFRSSNAAISSSIISIGRNPLAKRSIRTVLAADTALIILISVIGLAMALALVFVPV